MAAYADRDEALTAFGTLGERDREVLRLVTWDGLSAPEAADALGHEVREGTLVDHDRGPSRGHAAQQGVHRLRGLVRGDHRLRVVLAQLARSSAR